MLSDFFEKKVNIVYERAKFNNRNQKDGKKAQGCVSCLVGMAKKLRYGVLTDELVLDRLVIGIRDKRLSENLQMDETLTLETAINNRNKSLKNKRKNFKQMKFVKLIKLNKVRIFAQMQAQRALRKIKTRKINVVVVEKVQHMNSNPARQKTRFVLNVKIADISQKSVKMKSS